MESRLHSPPDKQEIRVCLLFNRPNVFITSLVYHTEILSIGKLENQNFKYLGFLFFVREFIA
jgi:hypothetical protein